MFKLGLVCLLLALHTGLAEGKTTLKVTQQKDTTMKVTETTTVTLQEKQNPAPMKQQEKTNSDTSQVAQDTTASRLDCLEAEIREVQKEVRTLKEQNNTLSYILDGVGLLCIVLMLGLVWTIRRLLRSSSKKKSSSHLSDIEKAEQRNNNKSQHSNSAYPTHPAPNGLNDLQKRLNQLESDNKGLKEAVKHLDEEIQKYIRKENNKKANYQANTPSSDVMYYIDDIQPNEEVTLSRTKGDKSFFVVKDDGYFDIVPNLDQAQKNCLISSLGDMKIVQKEGNGSKIEKTIPGQLKQYSGDMKWKMIKPIIITLIEK